MDSSTIACYDTFDIAARSFSFPFPFAIELMPEIHRFAIYLRTAMGIAETRMIHEEATLKNRSA